MRFARLSFAWIVAIAGAVAAASCIASAPTGIHRSTDEGGSGSSGDLGLDGSAPLPDSSFDAGPSDPHAVLGTKPSHGPFAGGERIVVNGAGFGAKSRVWFGATEADPKAVVPIDPTMLQVDTPPGNAGPVDISVQNGDDASTRRTLAGGYVYDKLYAAPPSGPVSGGTVIEIIGQGTAWDATSVPKIDQKPCTTVTIDTPTLIACTVPKGTPGAKSVSVTTGSETIVVLDAYTYEDSANGFKGGLSGAPLAGHLKVLAFDNFSGDPIPGAYAIAGQDLAAAVVKQTDASGVALIDDSIAGGPVTVTVAAKCHSPISFVAEPVDTVTAYLDPVMDPSCGSGGGPPPVGGKTQDQGIVSGQLVWAGGLEFQKAPWKNVPSPIGPSEKQAAYVFYAANDPTTAFQIAAGSPIVTPDSPGDVGYSFSLVAPPGNRALYAVAGIEDDSVAPPKFTAYAMGVIHGVPIVPNAETPNVLVNMTSTLDQVLTLDVAAPITGPKGPDTLRATVALLLGNDGYAILPSGQKTALLPVQAALPFVGVPSLVSTLVGSSYQANVRAVTGPTGTAPMSVVARVLATTTAQPLQVKGFVPIPTLVTPALNTAWDGKHLEASFGPVGQPVDFTEFQVTAGNGLITWTVVAPQGSGAAELPDLSGFPQAGIPNGPVVIAVVGAYLGNFNYGSLRYRDMRPQNMAAYSLDYFPAHL